MHNINIKETLIRGEKMLEIELTVLVDLQALDYLGKRFFMLTLSAVLA